MVALFLGVLPLLISITPINTMKYLSQLFKAIWLFFPAILFLLLSIFCFWALGQGKDLIIAFINNDPAGSFLHIYYARLIFFLIIGFWAYFSWYTSRIIAYIKKKRQKEAIQKLTRKDDAEAERMYESNDPAFEIGKPVLDEFPRLIGNACFLILELAVLQLPVLSLPLHLTWAFIIFIVALLALHFINKWIDETQSQKKELSSLFWLLLTLFLLTVVIISFKEEINIWALFVLLLFFHAVFIFYTNLRRVQMEKNALAAKVEKQQEVKPTWLERSMDYFCIPRKEKGYYKWFLYIGIASFIVYILTFVSLKFARVAGPFPVVLLGFAVLLAFGNTVTAFSVRYNTNFHFLLFVMAFIIGGLHETHEVKIIDLPNTANNYSQRPKLKEYLTTWLNEHNVSADSSEDGYKVYFVMANGGASRSGYWTASVLGTIEDESIKSRVGKTDTSRFSDHLFCLSGTSGGGVGVATFFALLNNKQNIKPKFNASAVAFLKNDYFTYTFARLLGPDFFNYIIPYSSRMDRARALESSFESSAEEKNPDVYTVPFSDNFSNFVARDEKKERIILPILCINTTRMQDGNPGVVTNLCLDSATFNNRVDVVKLLDPKKDITIASAAILGARFPYLSPAGKIANNYFVDGGYFDNSGAGVVQEIIRGIINIGKTDSMHTKGNGILYKQVKKLHFKVIHITNSPVISDSSNIKDEAPIKNDLLAPILTITGAYDMQTTVNDGRLINFIKDIDSFSTNRADYTQLPLYKDTTEWRNDPLRTRFKKEPPYAMNWFMSDTTRNRIDDRLRNHKALSDFIQRMRTKTFLAKK